MNAKEELLYAILKSSNSKSSGDNKKLTCAEAFNLAQKYNTKIIEIGHICNEHNIKIIKCQLGCF